jgi:hypothetical protein
MASLDIETLGNWYNELVSVKKGIVDTYAARTGMTTEKLGKMMANETWMSASEAVNYGFADEVIPGGQPPAADAAIVNALHYQHVPAILRRQFENASTSKPANIMTPAAIRLREEVRMITRKGV